MRSGTHLNAISNRLAASSPRARFLGMVVGEALSSLVDTGDKIMDFKMDEMKTPEAMWLKNLVTVSDTIGPLDPIKSQPLVKVAKKIGPRSAHKPVPPPKPVPRGSKIMSIEEVEDSNGSNGDESDTDGLVPYAKPDSDNEDSDEDPTLFTRDKPTVPVYIRDLINYLRDTENYDKQKLALQSAAPLIRRKATFGKEVSSHSAELAALLVGLQDKYDMDNFTDMRQQALIAILIAQPTEMGKWLSKTFFDGDFSISQRAAILTALGLGARELGGLDGANTSIASKSAFPSKALPAAMHKLYADTTTENGAIDVLSTELSNTMIAPMAAELADKLTGPSILKIRTFSSRMAVEKKRKRPIANSLGKIVAESFFFPLTGRFLIHLRAFGSSRSNVVFQPYLLSLFIKTLSLLLHASGPSTLSLPQMTSEFWDLLLALRTQSIGDIAVAEAMLFGFFTILEINEDKRGLVTENGRQMLETQKWVEDIFGRVGDGGGEEDERIRMLAAGCLVRIREAVEKYQGLLMGDLASFQS
jgi:telomere length regulation protein